MQLTSWTALAAVSVVLVLNTYTTAQENAQKTIPRSLLECYRDPHLLQRDNLLPMTITTLINLIRKVEDSPGFNQDMRQLSVSLIHRFRLDGIKRSALLAHTELESIIPYSPKGSQFDKHQFLLQKLLQGNANQFPNNTLTAVERCTLHAMLSSSTDTRVRGDESQRCNQLAQYRSERVPRSLSFDKSSNINDDVEILKNEKHSALKIRQRDTMANINMMGIDIENDQDNDHDNGQKEDVIPKTFNEVDTFNTGQQNSDKSQCPVETGVIHTDWGTVAGGPLIQGIASGLQPIKVLLSQVSSKTFKSNRQIDYRIDNKWAATLAGDLAQVVLRQGLMYKDNMVIGASGAWNSTTLPKWYFLTQKDQLHITDAEIRGGIDGLIIASKVQDWRSGMKLSQLLDMYYSSRGILSTGLRACDRKKNFIEFVPLDELKKQTIALAFPLSAVIDAEGQMTEEQVKKYSEIAANKLSTYVPEKLNDPSCETTSAIVNDTTNIDIGTDLYIFLDTSWQYEAISNILFYVLRKININKYGSRITLLNANDGKVITNTTESAEDVFQGWNLTVHQQHGPGFNLPTILRTIHNISLAQMLGERQNSSVGGRSFVALLVPNAGTVNEADSNYAADYLWRLREEVPDLKFLFLAGGTVNRFARFVQSEGRDIFAARQGENVPNQARPVIKRISETHRRIINPKCGPNWDNGESAQHQLKEEISPGGIKYYRILSNYFFKEDANRKLKIQGQGSSVMQICSTRSIEHPRMNMTNKPGDLNCLQVTNNEFVIDLSNPCADHNVIHQCPPFYISIEGGKSSSTPTQCNDCKHPDSIQFLIKTENLGCFSGVGTILANFILILLAFLSISYV